MQLLAIPFTPTRAEYVYLQGKRILADQMDFLLAHFPRNSPLRERAAAERHGAFRGSRGRGPRSPVGAAFGGAVEEGETAMLETTYFWQALASIALIWLLWHYRVFHRIGAALDKRGERVSAELDEARRLRADAESLLREYEVKRSNAETEAEAIITAAREEAERMTREAEERLQAFVARRTRAAEDKIAAAEQQAMIEVRDAAIASAVSASETVLREQARGAEGERFLREGLDQIRGRLAS